jgi:hypothetical protein
VSQVWDLDSVSPLFRVPSCVLFTVQSSEKQPLRSIPAGGIAGLSFSGQLPRSQVHWDEAAARLAQIPGVGIIRGCKAVGARRARRSLQRLWRDR